jgi:glycosyltransferase involved in cell wall biosynthesis
MAESAPLVSILITTYNRSELLMRAVSRVLAQDFYDFELIIIDDCSSDDTPEVAGAIDDPRVRYIRNEVNVGGTHGDRAHIRRFIYELMRGKYYVYVCDDDYWLPTDLLSRQVAAFEEYPNLAIAIGAQLSYFITTPDSYFAVEAPYLGLDNIHRWFDLPNRETLNPHLNFRKEVFPSGYQTSEQFLERFANDPAGSNMIGGAMLYSREKFISAGALSSEKGSQWQAGFELVMGPASTGDIYYIDEPCIITEVRPTNASFMRTQVEHYEDSILSIEIAMTKPLTDAATKERRAFLTEIKNRTIRNLSRAYMHNTLSIKRTGELSLCSDDNLVRPVTWKHIMPTVLKNRVGLESVDWKLLGVSAMPPVMLTQWDRLRGRGET